MSSGTLQTDFAGARGRLFRLALISSVLTVLTLGIYRFWMKTRLRRYYWSAIRPGGQPLEYVGEPLEKLLGFLIAVTILAFYVGVVNLLLMFLSFSFLNTNLWAYALSFAGIVPILFYARYRARRYILARTRWRGLRFGMDQGAWGYTWRALLHWSITILTLGLLWPRMTFWLEKYRTDRTFFGSERFNQSGRWQMLYPPFLPLLFGLIIVGLTVGAYAATDRLSWWMATLGALFIVYGVVHYRVHSFRLLMNCKTVAGVSFRSAPRPWRVLRIYLLGYSLVAGALAIFLAIIGLAAFAVLAAYGVSFDDDLNLVDIGAVPLWVTSLASAMTYFWLFITWGALKHALVTLPLARHYAQTLSLGNAANLGTIRQRHRDELDTAEGFAEALDVGAAI